MICCLAGTVLAQSSTQPELMRRLRASAAAGDAESQYELSRELYLEEDDAARLEAETWLRAAAERGHPEAEYRLAEDESARCGMHSDHCPEMIDLLQRAADHSLARASFRLGLDYREGYGVHPDAVAAFYQFQQAAASGHAGAAKELRVAYRDGIVVSVDPVESYKWFAIACHRWISGGAVQGQQAYWQNRDEAAARLTPAQRREANAVQKWLDNFYLPAQRLPPGPEWLSVLSPLSTSPNRCDIF